MLRTMLTLKPIDQPKVWEKFLLDSPQVNFLSSWQWGEMHRQLNQLVLRYGIYNQERLVGLVQLIKVVAKRATYLECSGGPVIDWSQASIKWLFNQLKLIARKEKASFIRIRPNILATPENWQLYKTAGLQRSPMHLHAETTWVLLLQPDEETLLKNMRKTTRYLIKKAEKQGVEIKLSTDTKDIDVLYRLQQATVERKHFVPFSREYFLAEFNCFLPDCARIFKAVYQGRVLAMALILFYGNEAVYHYSGSANIHRGVPASYLLQWAVIKEAKKRGLARYNLWGFTDNPKHRFFGPSLFKKGFGGEKADYLPAHDLVVNPGYWLNWLIETMRRHWRHL